MHTRTLKYTYVLVLCFCALYIGLMYTTNTHAQEKPVTSDPMPMDHSKMDHARMTPEEMRAMMETSQNTSTTPSPNIREARRTILNESQQNRMINLGENVRNRFGAIVLRFDNIIGRIETRLAKLEAEGNETIAARERLGEAKISLAAARSTLETMPTVRASVSSETPRESFAQIRADFLRVRDLLKQTHTELRETVRLMKQTPVVQQENTTTTATSTSE